MQIRQPRCRCREGWHDPVSSLWGSLCLYLGLAGRAQTVRSAHVVPRGASQSSTIAPCLPTRPTSNPQIGSESPRPGESERGFLELGGSRRSA